MTDCQSTKLPQSYTINFFSVFFHVFPLNPLLIVLPIVSRFPHSYRENKSPKLIKHEVFSIRIPSNSLQPLPTNFTHNVKPSNNFAKASSHVKKSYHLKQPGWFLEKDCRMTNVV